MKRMKLAAAVTAAAAAFAPFSPFGICPQDTPAVYADVIETLPEWVPTDLQSTLDFLNTYGRTHIEDGLICTVFKEQYEKVPEGVPQGVLRYELMWTTDSMKKIKDDIYGNEMSESCYQVAVFLPHEAGDCEVALIDTWLKGGSQLDFGYRKAIAHYTFHLDSRQNITQTDIYGWLPDCPAEYADYTAVNGKVSVHGNYVLFALEYNADTLYSWQEASQDYSDYFTQCMTQSCSTESVIPVPGGKQRDLAVYQAVQDGTAKISWEFGSFMTEGKTEETLTADCVILDKAQTVLLGNQARFRFVDAETGELTDFPKKSPEAGYSLSVYVFDDSDSKTDTGLVLGADSNPYIWTVVQPEPYPLTFTYELNDLELKKLGYQTAEEQVKPKRLANGAQDVTFLLKKTAEEPVRYQAIVTLLDFDTGKPVIINSDDEFSICEQVFDTMDLPVIAQITENPCTLKDLMYLPVENDEVRLVKPRHYSWPLVEHDGHNTVDKNYCTCVQDKNGVYHVTYRLKFTPTGDCTGDRKFYADDIQAFQKWLLSDPTTEFAEIGWKGVDFNNDDRLDVRDLTLMKRDYLRKTQIPTEISITETGGYDGICIVWRVYQKDGKYYISKQDKREEPEIVEIPENVFDKIMQTDFHRIIEEYCAVTHLPVYDGIDYYTVLTFPDGTTRQTGASMGSVVHKLDDLRFDWTVKT